MYRLEFAFYYYQKWTEKHDSIQLNKREKTRKWNVFWNQGTLFTIKKFNLNQFWGNVKCTKRTEVDEQVFDLFERICNIFYLFIRRLFIGFYEIFFRKLCLFCSFVCSVTSYIVFLWRDSYSNAYHHHHDNSRWNSVFKRYVTPNHK